MTKLYFVNKPGQLIKNNKLLLLFCLDFDTVKLSSCSIRKLMRWFCDTATYLHWKSTSYLNWSNTESYNNNLKLCSLIQIHISSKVLLANPWYNPLLNTHTHTELSVWDGKKRCLFEKGHLHKRFDSFPKKKNKNIHMYYVLLLLSSNRCFVTHFSFALCIYVNWFWCLDENWRRPHFWLHTVHIWMVV